MGGAHLESLNLENSSEDPKFKASPGSIASFFLKKEKEREK